MNDTIAAVATAHGIGSISIIRLSGESSLNIAKTLSKRSLKALTVLRPRILSSSNVTVARSLLLRSYKLF